MFLRAFIALLTLILVLILILFVLTFEEWVLAFEFQEIFALTKFRFEFCAPFIKGYCVPEVFDNFIIIPPGER